MISHTATVFQLTSRHDPIMEFFLIVRPYKVATVRSDYHDNLSALKNGFFLRLMALSRIGCKHGARYALMQDSGLLAVVLPAMNSPGSIKK